MDPTKVGTKTAGFPTGAPEEEGATLTLTLTLRANPNPNPNLSPKVL